MRQRACERSVDLDPQWPQRCQSEFAYRYALRPPRMRLDDRPFGGFSQAHDERDRQRSRPQTAPRRLMTTRLGRQLNGWLSTVTVRA